MSTETAPGSPDPSTRAGRAAPWDPASQHRFVTSDGTALYVRDTDSVPAGALTVVMLHGWALDHSTWDRVAEELPKAVDKPVRVLRYDHRGHGGSAPSPRGTATIAQLADDLAELIAERVPTGPILLAGHSIGGMTIMALAERHPEALERVVGVVFVTTSAGDLAKPSFGLSPFGARTFLFGERLLNFTLNTFPWLRLLKWTLFSRPLLRWLLFGVKPRKADVSAVVAQVGRCDSRSYVGFRMSLMEHDRLAALAAVRGKPVVLLAGGADRLTPPDHARRIAAELPNAEFVLFPGAGHMVPMERDAETTAHIVTLVRWVTR
jgi:pimeloyl-ACP methyl ester carboxylesterase